MDLNNFKKDEKGIIYMYHNERDTLDLNQHSKLNRYSLWKNVITVDNVKDLVENETNAFRGM